jgi:hypothetical protein
VAERRESERERERRKKERGNMEGVFECVWGERERER